MSSIFIENNYIIFGAKLEYLHSTVIHFFFNYNIITKKKLKIKLKMSINNSKIPCINNVNQFCQKLVNSLDQYIIYPAHKIYNK